MISSPISGGNVPGNGRMPNRGDLRYSLKGPRDTFSGGRPGSTGCTDGTVSCVGDGSCDGGGDGDGDGNMSGDMDGDGMADGDGDGVGDGDEDGDGDGDDEYDGQGRERGVDIVVNM